MDITSQPARGKRFATVRFHDGYDIDQVDRRLEELEEAVGELRMRESVLEEANGLLRSQVSHARERAATAEAELARLQGDEPPTGPAEPPTAPPGPAAGDGIQASSRAAVRLLEIATGESESLVASAREDAARIVAEAETRVHLLLDVEHQTRTHLVTFFRAQLDELGQPSLAETLAADDAEPPVAVRGL